MNQPTDNESLAILASSAAMEVEGVHSLSSSIAGNIAQALGVGRNINGLKITEDKGKVIIDMYLVISHGKRIPDIAWQVQEHVKSSIEAAFDIAIKEININIQEIKFEKEDTG